MYHCEQTFGHFTINVYYKYIMSEDGNFENKLWVDII